MPAPFKVKAVYEYKSEEPDDLNFENGQIITVIEEDDADWYTGEYQDASGQRREGIFPRNFVEKYEPAIPSRPVRNRAPPPAETKAQEAPIVTPASPPQAVAEPRVDPLQEIRQPQTVEQSIPQSTTEPTPITRTPSFPAENKPVTTKPPPPVADKPSSNSFRDRIAAFNKPAAAPVAPFKPSGGGTGFIKKPFVAPPPSRNSYVPPPTQPAPQKIYRREEDPSVQKGDIEQDEVVNANTSVIPPVEDDQPKPTSLKDRIALLQQQQLEQAQKTTEKKKAKKPPTQRADSVENVGETIASTEAPLTRQETGDTLGKRSIDTSRFAETESIDDDRSVVNETVLPTNIPPPSRELVSDTNDADDSGAGDTEDAPGTSTEEERHDPTKIKSPTHVSGNVGGNEAEEEEEDTEEEEDEETRRRRELRERMAKMSGGMGMMGMFGGGMPTPSKKAKPTGQPEYRSPESQAEEETTRAPPVPIMALPGMTSRPQQPQSEDEDSEAEEVTSHTPVEATRPMSRDEDVLPGQFTRSSTDRSIPTVSQERAIPPPVPRETRAVPPPPPVDRNVPESPRSPPARAVPPPPPVANVDERPLTLNDDTTPSLPDRTTLERNRSTRISSPPGMAPPVPGRRSTEEPLIEPMSATSLTDKRASRAPPPPIPGQVPPPSQTRAPPPPPPGQPPIRRPTGGSTEIREPVNSDDDSEGEVTEYDGDYDTDIASSAKHKDALKAHNRYSSMDDEGTFTDDAAKQASSPPARAVPPLPPTGPPRDVPPPPPPTQQIPRSRPSTEIPRSLPPPIPITRPEDDEYDPYSYQTPRHGMPTPPVRAPQSPPLQSPIRGYEDEDIYSAPSHPPPGMSPPTVPLPPVPSSREGPPPPPIERAAPPPPPSGPLPSIPSAAPMVTAPQPPKQSMDIGRHPTIRHSTDTMRPAGDLGFIASDVDLAFASGWWTHENTPPPSISARPDVLYEVESSTSTKRGGKTTITRDIYVLYMDYSQTTINVTFDANDPSQPSMSQSHERPPPPPRQDQLEQASSAFGSQIARAASATSGNTVGDGSPQSLVYEMLRPLQSTALMPVGTRSYGALVYANLANASTQQFDEIRPGDIVTFRNAKFAGHKGGLHAKYSMDVGKPDHVGVVIDWDGTKKKIRAWEQGREDKSKKSKVRDESFRIGDLKSGEVRVWRVMPRGWVGWNNS